MMTLKEIADYVGGELLGDPDIQISSLKSIKEAMQGDITFISNPKYLPLIDAAAASCVIVSKNVSSSKKPLIRVENPDFAFAKLVSKLSPVKAGHPNGISKSAVVAQGARLGKAVGIGCGAIISEDAAIGDNTIIYPNVFIGEGAKIGNNCLIWPGVCIRERVQIGDNVIIHANTTIGSDGFGFTKVADKLEKIPQIGIVVIEDNVEIGANCAVDRARLGKTVIGEGSKIDNLVHIAHNVTTGKNCIIVAQAGISGSTELGNNVVLAGQVGLVGHISLGDNVVVMAQSGVSKSIPADTIVFGYPAREQREAKEINACLGFLPKLFKRVKELESKINGKSADNS